MVLIVVPGPSVLFVVGRGLAHGRGVAVLSALGNALGALVLVVVVAVGVGAVVAEYALVLTVVKFLGAAYLVYLGIETIRNRRHLIPTQSGVTQSRRGWRAVWDGFVVGVTNPKTLVFFLAALPQFVDAGRGGVGPQLLLLGALFTTIAFASDSCYALLAGTVRRWFVLVPRRMEAAGYASGAAMIGLGVHFAVSGQRQ